MLFVAVLVGPALVLGVAVLDVSELVGSVALVEPGEPVLDSPPVLAVPGVLSAHAASGASDMMTRPRPICSIAAGYLQSALESQPSSNRTSPSMSGRDVNSSLSPAKPSNSRRWACSENSSLRVS